MALDGRELLSLVRRIGAVDTRARGRLARLMEIGDMEASAVLALAGRAPLTRADLRAQLELSVGGAHALTRMLADRALVVREPDANDRTAVQLRLSDGAEAELAAALHGLVEQLDAIATRLTDDDAGVVVRLLDALADVT
jgi:DNA-binding MarR family transcriptional regulator